MAAEEEKQAIIFFTVIAFTVLAFVALWLLNLLQPLFILLVILAVLIVIYSQARTFFAQVQEYERIVVFRMGKFKRVAGPGWIFMIPFLETYKRVDLRVVTVDIKPQEVITRDNIKLSIDAVIYMRIHDAKAAIINVADYKKAAISYIQAHLRDVVGKMLLENVIANIGKINELLHSGLEKVGKDWGIRVDKVEVQTVQLPREVIGAMHERKAAEQQKFAQVERAEAKRITIDAVQAAAGNLTSPTLQYMYLQALEKIAEGKSTKFIFPLELSRLAAAVSSRIGIPYEESQSKVLDRYKELSAEGKKPRTIIETIRKEEGVSEEEVKPTKEDIEEAKEDIKEAKKATKKKKK